MKEARAFPGKKPKGLDVLKLLGAVAAILAVFIPIMTAILQYRQSVQEP